MLLSAKDGGAETPTTAVAAKWQDAAIEQSLMLLAWLESDASWQQGSAVATLSVMAPCGHAAAHATAHAGEARVSKIKSTAMRRVDLMS